MTFISCAAGEAETEADGSDPEPVTTQPRTEVVRAHLFDDDADGRVAFARVKEHFETANPGYAMTFLAAATEIAADASSRLVFVQTPVEEEPAAAEIHTASGTSETDLHVGDIAVLRPGERLTVEPAIAALVFDVPDTPGDGVPAAIRPDWDPNITDVPGGCATETGAYRRILLTWLKDNGPYTFHGLNAHRVRITDSFTHYHPVDTGFDEFYLVQMSNDEDRLLTSYHAEAIESPETMTAELAGQLFEVHDVRAGDLIYLPRGVIHRGLGGVLAQVITVPGFRPGTEIGVDHHLLAINERLGLEGDDALPYNVEASTQRIVR
ncbi:MAG: hypothetical protein F4112_00730 [Holophagales bacterium]|nr:hypothetical protein [Holophagales bacterium]MYD22600.1 hypothetical protein [Holophagales bacterium]MYI31470.1 hypothetical protein [Holophagales bacterium]